MKKLLTITVVLTLVLPAAGSLQAQRVKLQSRATAEKEASSASDSDSGRSRGSEKRRVPDGPGRDLFADARTDDGKLELAKMTPLLLKEFDSADKDKDGTLSAVEQQGVSILNRRGGPGERRPGERRPGEASGPSDPFADARTDDGKIDLSKLPQSLPAKTAKALVKVDKNKDGFLNEAEEEKIPKNLLSNQPEQKGRDADRRPEGQRDGAEGRRGPGGEGGHGFNPLDRMKNADGKIELAKLPEQMPEEFKTRFKEADKDKDGFLDETEQKAIAPPRSEDRGNFGGDFFADARTDDGKIDLKKGAEVFQKKIVEADKDKDGFLSVEEQRTLSILRFGGHDGMGGPGFNPFDRMKNADGKIELSKLPEQMPEEFKARLKKADLDNDGLLDESEQKALTPPSRPE